MDDGRQSSQMLQRVVGGGCVWSTESEGLENILSRLPIVSMLQCRTVCKIWNNIIASGSYKKLWSKRNSASYSWIVMVDLPPGSGTASFIFYNVCTHEWCARGFEFGNLLYQLSMNRYLLATSYTSRGLIFIMPDHFLLAALGWSILVLNPFTGSHRLISLPRLSRGLGDHVTEKLGAALKVTVVYGQYGSGDDKDEHQQYKILVLCNHGHNVWTYRMYNPSNERWMGVPWPLSSERFNRHYLAADCIRGRDLIAVQQLSQLCSSSSNPIRRVFHFAVILHSELAPGNIKGCVDVIRAQEFTSFRLCIPWSWDRGSYPYFKLGVIQRGNILINPYLEVTMDLKCTAIKINTLEMRYGSSELYKNDEVWRIEAVMPDELFQYCTVDSTGGVMCMQRHVLVWVKLSSALRA